MRMPLGVEQGKTLLTRVTLVVASAAATFAFMPTSAAAPTGQGEQRQVAATQDSRETVDLYGKQVAPEVAENIQKYAQENNLDLEAEFKEKPVTQDPKKIAEESKYLMDIYTIQNLDHSTIIAQNLQTNFRRLG